MPWSPIFRLWFAVSMVGLLAACETHTDRGVLTARESVIIARADWRGHVVERVEYSLTEGWRLEFSFDPQFSDEAELCAFLDGRRKACRVWSKLPEFRLRALIADGRASRHGFEVEFQTVSGELITVVFRDGRLAFGDNEIVCFANPQQCDG